MAENIDVFVFQVDIPSLTVSMVGFRCGSAPYGYLLAVAIHHLLLKGARDAVGDTDQSDEHEDAPRHRQSREGCAQLVVAHGLEYFVG